MDADEVGDGSEPQEPQMIAFMSLKTWQIIYRTSL
jgi:hypothetical protein